MFQIKTYNKISEEGLSILKKSGFEVSDSFEQPDALILRSHSLHDESLPSSLKAIGRAGAGVNNIPVGACTKQNIVVFNTPGANANAVKELVFTGMLLSARDIIGGITFSNSLRDHESEIGALVEKQKSKFKGYEIKGKTLGVIGLGAIGVMVANDAVSMGLNVQGYDPFISVDRAWGLSRAVEPVDNLNKLLGSCDFITVHMPVTEKTKDFMAQSNLSKVKKGSVLLNFSRAEIVNEKDVIEALNSNILGKYVTDFPTLNLLKTKNTICIPHLGASTKEAEDNCSIMVSKQMREFLLYGNIKNSVNFPDCSFEKMGDFRLVITNQNIPTMVSQITATVAEKGLNIVEMMNKSRNELAYNILDLKGDPNDNLIKQLKQIEGVNRVRLIN